MTRLHDNRIDCTCLIRDNIVLAHHWIFSTYTPSLLESIPIVKYHQVYERSHTVREIPEEGSVTTQYFTLEDGTVLLAPDVRKYFPYSESVNQALRGLIRLIPQAPQEVA